MTSLKGFLFTLVFIVLFSLNSAVSYASNSNNNKAKTEVMAVCDANYNFSIQTVGAKQKGEIIIVPTSRVNFYAPNSHNKEQLNYLWTFNDGTTSTEINPVHIFDVCGNYNVSLMVMDEAGQLASQTISKEITVEGICLDLDNVPKTAQRYKIPADNTTVNDIVAEQ